jgi:hypothetical protein
MSDIHDVVSRDAFDARWEALKAWRTETYADLLRQRQLHRDCNEHGAAEQANAEARSLAALSVKMADLEKAR